MIVTFDTNAYRNLVSRKSIQDAKSLLEEIKKKEREKNITPMMSTTVAMELLSHLLDKNDSISFVSCFKACQLIYQHCGNSQEFRVLPLPETQISMEYFGIHNQKFQDTQIAIGHLLYRIYNSPSLDTIDQISPDILKIKNFIHDAETTLIISIEEMCRKIDPSFSNWTLFKDDNKKRKAFLSFVRSDNFKIETALAYLCAINLKLVSQGYELSLTEDKLKEMCSTYLKSYSASLEFRSWFFCQLVNGGFDLSKNSRTNFLWDELILHLVGHECSGNPICLITSDKKMIEGTRRSKSKGPIMNLDNYLKYLGLS